MNNELHIHEDLDEAIKWYDIPLIFKYPNYVYIMQDSRCVFVGSTYMAKQFYDKNNGKYCETAFKTIEK